MRLPWLVAVLPLAAALPPASSAGRETPASRLFNRFRRYVFVPDSPKGWEWTDKEIARTPWLVGHANQAAPDNRQKAEATQGRVDGQTPELRQPLSTSGASGGSVSFGGFHERSEPPETFVQDEESIFVHPRTMVISPLPDAFPERERLKQQHSLADIQPTGFYLNPKQNLTVEISGVDEHGPPVSMLLRKFNHTGYYSVQPRLLRNGRHQVSHEIGGIIYIWYTYKQRDVVPPPITVTLEGPATQPFPFFRQGITTDDQWRTMLQSTKVPFAELVGERVIVSATAEKALIYARGEQNQEELLDRYKTLIGAQDAISGLSPDAQDARDRPSPLRTMVTLLPHHIGGSNEAYALPGVVYLGPKHTSHMWWQTALCFEAEVPWEEFGHHYQQTWTWDSATEMTFSIYSLAVGRSCGDAVRMNQFLGGFEPAWTWENVKTFLAADESIKAAWWDAGGRPLYHLALMFEQLRVAFDDFYPILHRRYRASNQVLQSDANKKHYFMTQAAEIAGRNLTPFFARWGLRPEPRPVAEMSRQPDATKDYTETPVLEDVKVDLSQGFSGATYGSGP